MMAQQEEQKEQKADDKKKESSVPDDLQLCIGHRIAVKEHRGTIRYVGPVATSKKATTVWLGIEWDDINRGKNDGSVKTADGKIHRYFTCEDGRGSFIKPVKANFGRDVLTVILDRYSLDVCSLLFRNSHQARMIVQFAKCACFFRIWTKT